MLPNENTGTNGYFSKYNFIEINKDHLQSYNPNLKLFEQKMSQKYPLGNDSFSIDHGEDYFAFFKRLGEVQYMIIQNSSELIVGTACSILRTYPTPNQDNKQGESIAFWYLCDLKIDKDHRGKKLTSKLFMQMLSKFMSKSYHGYLISMDPASKQIVHIMNGIEKFLPNKLCTKTLWIYSVTVNTMIKIESYFVNAFNHISYLSLIGMKDLILTSTNKPIQLYHLQHGTFAATNNTKQLLELPDNATIMFCFPDNSPLQTIVQEFDIKTDISATIISLSMDFFDWHDILTSDI